MKTHISTIYTADDGKEFTSELACLDYETEQELIKKNMTFWAVLHTPDTTEGRGWYKLLYLRVICDSYCLRELIDDYCYRSFERPIAFVMGVSPIAAWILRKTDLIEWQRAIIGEQHTSVGDYKYKAQTISLIMGEGERGLIEEESRIQS